MKVTAEMMFLGTEDGKTKDGKTYTKAGFLQGINSEIIFLNDDSKSLLKGIKPMTQVRCFFNIQIGERTYVNLLDVTPVDTGK